MICSEIKWGNCFEWRHGDAEEKKIALPMSHRMLGAGGETAILANESSLGSRVKIDEIIITESGIP